MSVEKSMLIRKAMRNFDAIYDAYLVDDEDVEKGMPSLSPKQMKIARQAGNPKKIDAADLAALRNRSNVGKAIWNDKDPKAGIAEAAAGGVAHSIKRALKDKKENKM